MELKNLEKIKQTKELKEKGLSYSQIGKILGITKSTANYFGKVDEQVYADKADKYKKEEETICELVRTSNNIHQVCIKFGLRGTNTEYERIYNIIHKYNLDISHFDKGIYPTIKKAVTKKKSLTLNEILCENVKYQSSELLKRLIKEGLKEKKCECCGLTEWQGKEIPLELHHINGNHNDNRIENLQLLCPNCHAQTDNFCRGKKERKHSQQLVSQQVVKYDKTKYVSCNFNLTKDEIIDEFKKYGTIDALEKKYKTSHKTIKQKCIEYELPATSKELRKYITELYGKQNWNLGGNMGNAHATNKKPILCFDLNNNLVKEYESVSAVQQDDFNKKIVRAVCLGKRESYNGYIFRYR